VDDVSFFALSLGHKIYLASATSGMDPTLRSILPDSKRYFGAIVPRPAPDALFVVYQAPGAHSHRLVPLAVFSMQSQVSAVTSIQARDDSAP